MSLEIREMIQEIAKEVIDREFGVPCEVISYDQEAKTIDCEPIDGKADYLTVKLQAEPKSGLLFVPKVGSIVILEQTSNDSAYVSLFGEVDEIVLLDGENKGLVKVTELVEKINKIESDINTLKSIFSAWTTVPNDGGAALKAAATSWYSQSLTNTLIEDLENEKISH